MPTPFVIDADPSDIHVLHSGLELKNRSIADEAMAHNRAIRSERKKASMEVMRQEAAVGAEYVLKRSTSAKTLSLSDVEKHYNLDTK